METGTKTKILLATRNPKKKRELEQILDHMQVHILTLDEIEEIPEIEEDGRTFEENAIKKARISASLSGYICLADDSGLVVDALDGKPGVYSARFSGENADDESNNAKLLQMMAEVEDKDRTARFICVIAISDSEGRVKTVSGSCEGRIAKEAVGTGGFGYDPLFIPEGFNQSFAQLPAEEKNAISHRGKALKKCSNLLHEYLTR